MEQAATISDNAGVAGNAWQGALQRECELLRGNTNVLSQLVAAGDDGRFSDEAVAHVRAMIFDLARQSFGGQDGNSSGTDKLAEKLRSSPELLYQCHALALEWKLTVSLDIEAGIDPVLSPFVQSLIATAGDHAMQLIAAQARYVEQQRRMALPLSELPAELLNAVLLARRNVAGTSNDLLEASIRRGFDETNTRLNRLRRLVATTKADPNALLDVAHAGVAVFLTALANRSGFSREDVVLFCHIGDGTQLALALRAAGCDSRAINRIMLMLRHDFEADAAFDTVSKEEAGALLAEQGVNG